MSNNHRIEEGQVKFSELIIDPSVQRDKEKGEINAIAGDFEPSALHVVTVSVRSNGDKVLIDGQQRLNAAAVAGYEEPVRALFHYNLTHKQEAALFRRLNFRRSVGATALFNAAITEGDANAIAINDLLVAYGTHAGYGGYSAIAAARRIVSYPNGLFSFRWALDVVSQVWGIESKHLDGRMIEALALLHNRYGDKIDTDSLRNKLAGTKGGIHGILGNAKTVQQLRRGRLPINVADVIIGIYNQWIKKEENKLPEWQR